MKPAFKIRADIFFSCFIIFTCIAVWGYISAFAKSEGTLGSGAIANFAADYILYIFPLIFLGTSIIANTFFVFFTSLTISIILYSYFATIVFEKRILRIRKYSPFNLTYYTIEGVLILLSVLLFSLFVKA